MSPKQKEKHTKLIHVTKIIQEIKSSGALSPSSRFLVDKTLKTVNFERARTIVELGSGNGCVTREILSRMHPEAKLIGFEISDFFFNECKKIDDDRLIMQQRSAAEIDQVIQEQGLEDIDYIISTLPLTIMPDEVIREIFEKSLSLLHEDGKFIQVQYNISNYFMLKKHFSDIDIKFTALNLPPAFVFICE